LGIGLLLGAYTVRGIYSLPPGATAPSPASAASLRPATPVHPGLSNVERKAAMDAILALKELESVTVAGINYTEYSRRMLDTRIKIDRFLGIGGGDPELSLLIQRSMELYTFARAAWNSKITKDYDQGEDPRVDLCPPVANVRDSATAEQYVPLAVARGISVAVAVPTLWTCASDNISAAERRLGLRSSS